MLKSDGFLLKLPGMRCFFFIVAWNKKTFHKQAFPEYAQYAALIPNWMLLSETEKVLNYRLFHIKTELNAQDPWKIHLFF